MNEACQVENNVTVFRCKNLLQIYIRKKNGGQ